MAPSNSRPRASRKGAKLEAAWAAAQVCGGVWQPMSVLEERKRLRADMLVKRRALVARHGFMAGRSVAMIGLDFGSVPYGATIGCYSPIRDEFDPLALVLKLEADGFPLALPVTQGRDKPLLWRAWKPGDAREPGPMGTKAPMPVAAEVEPRCILVPVVAFDAEGYRLGYGAGYYNRTLAHLRARNRKLVAIGIAFDEQRVETLPRLPSDQPLDWILTPTGATLHRRRLG